MTNVNVPAAIWIIFIYLVSNRNTTTTTIQKFDIENISLYSFPSTFLLTQVANVFGWVSG